jgi:hypothetical protein
VLSSEIHSVLHSIFNAGLKVLLQATYSLRGKMFCFVFVIGNSLLVITICYIFLLFTAIVNEIGGMLLNLPAGLAINRFKIQVTS